MGGIRCLAPQLEERHDAQQVTLNVGFRPDLRVTSPNFPPVRCPTMVFPGFPLFHQDRRAPTFYQPSSPSQRPRRAGGGGLVFPPQEKLKYVPTPVNWRRRHPRTALTDPCPTQPASRRTAVAQYAAFLHSSTRLPARVQGLACKNRSNCLKPANQTHRVRFLK